MTAATLTAANALKSIVADVFPAVGFTTAGTPELTVQGRHLPAGLRPPCVLILAGEGTYTDSTLTRRQQFHLILIDLLAKTDDARTAAALGRFDALQELFPSDGVQSGDVVFLPESFRLLDCPDARAAACLTVVAMSPAEGEAGSVSGSSGSSGTAVASN
ncbi:MAG: hypothetical protein IKQ16_08650 [Lentisphaeria bacterium]|jgi:hypothetical protein|nr:hypothetical protein [Lentisphaeria bacterium]